MYRSENFSFLALVVVSALTGVSAVGCRSTGLSAADPSARPDGISATPARGMPARLVHVVDGDTAYFSFEGPAADQREVSERTVKARIAGINAPECVKRAYRGPAGFRSAACLKDDEYYGMRAYQRLRALLDAGSRAGTLRLRCTRAEQGGCRRGTYGRALVTVYVQGRDIAEVLISEGLAWTYTKYPSKERRRYCTAEMNARADHRGMWGKGSVAQVLQRMSAKTRSWYRFHDQACARAARRPDA